jgi:hypothetical protein
MSKQELPQSALTGTREEKTLKEGRYYVQVLTEHIFLVRERQSISGKPGSDDTIVRSFDVRYDAYNYANSLNS